MDSTQQQTATGFQMTLTDRAAVEVNKFIEAEEVAKESAGLRVSVMPG